MADKPLGNIKIKDVRPKLRLVSPLTAAIVLGYGFTNLLLGIGLYNYVNVSPQALLAIVNNVMTFKVWGIVFFLLGAFKLYSYFRNDWTLMKLSLMVGVFIKFTWFIALSLRALDGASWLLPIVWLFFGYVQIITYVHFIPNVKQRLL